MLEAFIILGLAYRCVMKNKLLFCGHLVTTELYSCWCRCPLACVLLHLYFLHLLYLSWEYRLSVLCVPSAKLTLSDFHIYFNETTFSFSLLCVLSSFVIVSLCAFLHYVQRLQTRPAYHITTIKIWHSDRLTFYRRFVVVFLCTFLFCWPALIWETDNLKFQK